MSGNDPQHQQPSALESPYEGALKAALQDWRMSGKINQSDKALILALAAKIPAFRRQALLRDVEKELVTPSGRGSPVFENVIRLIDERPKWTTESLTRRLRNQGHSVDSKALSNCLNYMVKSGRLIRISRGHYAAAGFGIITSDSLIRDHDIAKGGENED